MGHFVSSSQGNCFEYLAYPKQISYDLIHLHAAGTGPPFQYSNWSPPPQAAPRQRNLNAGFPGIPGEPPPRRDDARTVRKSGTTITIANPPPGHAGYVGSAHAIRWIRQNRAAFDPDGRLRLSDRLKRAMSRNSVCGAEYDAIKRQMTSVEKRHIPLAQPPERPTRRRIGDGYRGRSGPAESIGTSAPESCD